MILNKIPHGKEEFKQFINELEEICGRKIVIEHEQKINVRAVYNLFACYEKIKNYLDGIGAKYEIDIKVFQPLKNMGNITIRGCNVRLDSSILENVLTHASNIEIITDGGELLFTITYYGMC